MGDESSGLNRRQFLRRAAVTTATAAWAAPVIQTIVARPAYAGTPVVCDHSACIGACAMSGNSQHVRRPSRAGVPGCVRHLRVRGRRPDLLGPGGLRPGGLGGVRVRGCQRGHDEGGGEEGGDGGLGG